jgi:hypothetical protein
LITTEELARMSTAEIKAYVRSKLDARKENAANMEVAVSGMGRRFVERRKGCSKMSGSCTRASRCVARQTARSSFSSTT